MHISCYFKVILSVLTVINRMLCCSDREYPRLGQMIVDYENPLKKMMEEFVPHGKVENITFLTCFLSWSGEIKRV